MSTGEGGAKRGEEAVVTIACVQMEPIIGERDKNVRRTLERVEEAAAAGARLVVLPELCSSGYCFASRAEAFALAEEVPAGPACRARIDLARRLDLHLAAAGAERGQPFIARSVIVSYTGRPIGGPASPDREEIIYATANLADARRKRSCNEYNQVVRDRRTDVYGEMLGADAGRGRY
jgi:predicted amidohydrolase